jgi:hypothetical protein
VIDFDGFCQLLGGQKVVLGKTKEDDSDTLDAFVALGGKEDKTGHVRLARIRWFVDCFGLPIDPGELLREMNTDHSGLVDYEQVRGDGLFCLFFFSLLVGPWRLYLYTVLLGLAMTFCRLKKKKKKKKNSSRKKKLMFIYLFGPPPPRRV